MRKIIDISYKPIVLIVDDSSFERACLIQILDCDEVVILTASSGEQALEILSTNDVALILLDVNMGGMNGFETAHRIRSLSQFEFLPIMFISGSEVAPERILEGYGAGAVDYLVKPVNPQWLISKVRVFCELSEQRRTIQQQLDEIKNQNEELEKRLDEIRELREIIPICASCRKVRDDDGYWGLLEHYISEQSGAAFSHSVCPDCKEVLYPGLAT